MTPLDPKTVLSALARPFPAALVSWRVGTVSRDAKKALALCYIDARDVQARLDEVCGVYWQSKHGELRAAARGGDEGEKRARRSGSIVTCSIGIKFGDEWIWRSDGAGDTAVEAEKGSMSDALKRAAVQWGVGRYLYAVESPWVEINDKKQIVEKEHARLRSILERGIAAWERNERTAYTPPPDTSEAPPAAPPVPRPEPRPAPAAPRQPEAPRREEAPAPAPQSAPAMHVRVAEASAPTNTGPDEPDAICRAITSARSLDDALSRLIEAKRSWPGLDGPFEQAFVEAVSLAIANHPDKREQIAARIAKLRPPVSGQPERRLTKLLAPVRSGERGRAS